MKVDRKAVFFLCLIIWNNYRQIFFFGFPNTILMERIEMTVYLVPYIIDL